MQLERNLYGARRCLSNFYFHLCTVFYGNNLQSYMMACNFHNSIIREACETVVENRNENR